MVDSRQKGARAENLIKDKLNQLTSLKFERTPLSGGLAAVHGLKGDLYLVPAHTNVYCIEAKHYKDDHVSSKLLTGKNPQILEWWEQTIRESKEVGREPLLIFKHDRSKIFTAYTKKPASSLEYIFLNIKETNLYISLLEDWIKLEKPEFVK